MSILQSGSAALLDPRLARIEGTIWFGSDAGGKAVGVDGNITQILATSPHVSSASECAAAQNSPNISNNMHHNY
jgi:hypothetical protein